MIVIILFFIWFVGYNNSGYYKNLRLNDNVNIHSKTLTKHYYGYDDEVLEQLINAFEHAPFAISTPNINPAEIAWNAQLLWNWHIEHPNDKDIQERFIFRAEWLKNNISMNDTDKGCWRFNFPLDKFGLKPNWCSALAQGHGISVLTKAFQLTGDSTYLRTAFLAIEPFKKSILDGGVLSTSIMNFYEEYPTKPDGNHVLNGFISSLLGLYDLYRATNDTVPLRLFTEGINTLKTMIPNYDIGFWSRYSLSPVRKISNHFDIASPFYHRLHIVQLQTLYRITNIETFNQYANIWQKYESSTFAFIWEQIYYIYKGAKDISAFYSGKKASLFSPVN